jgi:hypothetical protein
VLVEEVVDGVVSGAFDFSTDVVLVPYLNGDLVELVVVARVAVADVGAGGELRHLFKTEQLSATHEAAADHGASCRVPTGDAFPTWYLRAIGMNYAECVTAHQSANATLDS